MTTMTEVSTRKDPPPPLERVFSGPRALTVDQSEATSGSTTTAKDIGGEKEKRRYQLKVVPTEGAKSTFITSTFDTSFLQKGDHITINKGRYFHHALVLGKPVLTAKSGLKLNIAEFSVPGLIKCIGVKRVRTLYITAQMVAERVIARIDGHYDDIPEEKRASVRRSVVKRAKKLVKCRCLLCLCKVADECTCGRPERRCQNRRKHYQRYDLVSKNCEHWINSIFGEMRSFQVEAWSGPPTSFFGGLAMCWTSVQRQASISSAGSDDAFDSLDFDYPVEQKEESQGGGKEGGGKGGSGEESGESSGSSGLKHPVTVSEEGQQEKAGGGDEAIKYPVAVSEVSQ